MSKKHFLFYLCALLLLVCSVLAKQHFIRKKSQKSVVSFYSCWKEGGKPVIVKQVEKKDLNTTWKMTVVAESEHSCIGYVPKNLLRSLSQTMPASILVGGKKIPAHIREISTTLHPDTGMYRIAMDVQGHVFGKEEKHLAEVIVPGIKNSCFLPLNAIQKENQQPFVWLVQENRAHKKFVTLGEKNSEGVAASGVEEKESFIQGGASSIQENDLVNNGK